MQIIEATDDAMLAQASVVLRSACFASPADDLDDGGDPEFELVLIARDDAQTVVGMVEGRRPSWVVDHDDVERVSALLTYLAVDPARRREGIGSSLLTAFCERSRNAGADHVVLQIGYVTSERAAELTWFYLANGFAATEYGFRRELV